VDDRAEDLIDFGDPVVELLGIVFASDLRTQFIEAILPVRHPRLLAGDRFCDTFIDERMRRYAGCGKRSPAPLDLYAMIPRNRNAFKLWTHRLSLLILSKSR
jgi:hypothetical protein